MKSNDQNILEKTLTPDQSENRAAIDETVLQMLLGFGNDNNNTFLKELINIYLEETLHLISEMKTASENIKMETFTRAAHTLKSSSANLGAMHLSEMCKELEELGKSRNLNDIPKKITAVEQEFQRVNTALKKLQLLSQKNATEKQSDQSILTKNE